MEMLFTHYPLGHKTSNNYFGRNLLEIPTLMLFFLGNGCSKHLITEWILTSQHWTTLQKVSREQYNLDSKAKIWFYYDVHRGTWLFLNGEFRNTNNL